MASFLSLTQDAAMESSNVLPSISSPGSVTLCLVELKHGSVEAQEWFFHRMLPEITRRARRRVGKNTSRFHDEDDIASDVVCALILHASTFHMLKNRNDLQRLISRILHHKTVDASRRASRYRRTETEIYNFGKHQDDSFPCSLAMFADSNTMDRFSYELFDTLGHAIRSLDEDELQCRQILRLLAEGYSCDEVSQIVGRGKRSVERLRARIYQEFQKICQLDDV